MSETLKTSLVLLASGIAAVPVNENKIPLVKWKPYIHELPTQLELENWFSRSAAIALVAGKVQCLDFDEKYSKGIFARYLARAKEAGLDSLIDGLCRQRTPTGGFHLVWQCDGLRIGNLKLAQKLNKETMIETRGEGGYFLIAPSSGYEMQVGDWSSIPSISEDDRDALISLARTFDEKQPEEAFSEPSRPADAEATPGDDYDFRADVPALLRQHGWKQSGPTGKYWTRPGKKSGVSASWDVVPGRFWVFSSSTEFEINRTYKPWNVYAILECGGDFSRAAGELRRQGFGGTSTKSKTSTQPLPADWNPPVELNPNDPPAVDGVDPAGEAPTFETEVDKIRRLLKTRRFDPTKVPPPIRPIFQLGGVVICTPGNLTAITAQAKVGKSALVSALTAAAMTHQDVDTLTAVGFNEANKAFVYFDTEQSPDDFWHAVNRAKKRAGLAETPNWLHAFTIADLPANVGRKALAVAMADFAEQHGGIHAVILDGAADLVLDVNDAEECNGFVAELHMLAIRYDCAIICVVHFNPGSDKVRGHLGSQIERKAESNLRLEKDDEVTVIFSTKQRRAPIDKKTGPRFRWNDEIGMHVSVTEAPQTRTSMQIQDLADVAKAAFGDVKTMRRVDLLKAIVSVTDKSEATAVLRVKEMRKHGVLFTNSLGHYTMEKPAEV